MLKPAGRCKGFHQPCDAEGWGLDDVRRALGYSHWHSVYFFLLLLLLLEIRPDQLRSVSLYHWLLFLGRHRERDESSYTVPLHILLCNTKVKFAIFSYGYSQLLNIHLFSKQVISKTGTHIHKVPRKFFSEFENKLFEIFHWIHVKFHPSSFFYQEWHRLSVITKVVFWRCFFSPTIHLLSTPKCFWLPEELGCTEPLPLFQCQWLPFVLGLVPEFPGVPSASTVTWLNHQNIEEKESN